MSVPSWLQDEDTLSSSAEIEFEIPLALCTPPVSLLRVFPSSSAEEQISCFSDSESDSDESSEEDSSGSASKLRSLIKHDHSNSAHHRKRVTPLPYSEPDTASSTDSATASSCSAYSTLSLACL